MPHTVRSRNLDLYRKLRGGHNFTSARLKAVTNPAYLSEMANGDRTVTEAIARKLEVALKLPAGWLDQNNSSLLYLSTTDFVLLSTIQSMPNAVRSTLQDLVGHLGRPVK